MPITYAETYFPVLVQTLLAILIAGALITLSFVLGKRVKDRVKDSPYECGMAPTGSARERFSVKFYLVAIVFILFDIETIFLFPIAAELRAYGAFALGELITFVVLLAVAFVYVWRRGALEWR